MRCLLLWEFPYKHWHLPAGCAEDGCPVPNTAPCTQCCGWGHLSTLQGCPSAAHLEAMHCNHRWDGQLLGSLELQGSPQPKAGSVGRLKMLLWGDGGGGGKGVKAKWFPSSPIRSTRLKSPNTELERILPKYNERHKMKASELLSPCLWWLSAYSAAGELYIS